MGNFSGVWPALVTPFTTDDRVSVPVLRDQVEYLIGKEAGGFYVCGATGQGIFMSVPERKLVVETVLDQVQERVPVIVHVGSVACTDAMGLAEHAQRSGAAAVSSILPPLYRDSRSLYAYFEAVAAAAPDLPLLPYLYGGPADAVELMRELMPIPNVAGTKYTGPNMYEFKRLVELRSDNWTLFSGMDEQCLFAAMSGACGHIGSTLNIMLGVYRDIRKCYEMGDVVQALALQNKGNRIITVLYSYGFNGALREALRLLGLDCGQPRLPAHPFPENRKEAFYDSLEAAGFFELAQA